jgi:hypothetical protein
MMNTSHGNLTLFGLRHFTVWRCLQRVTQNHPLKAPAFENRKLTINLRRQCVVGAAAPKLNDID